MLPNNKPPPTVADFVIWNVSLVALPLKAPDISMRLVEPEMARLELPSVAAAAFISPVDAIVLAASTVFSPRAAVEVNVEARSSDVTSRRSGFDVNRERPAFRSRPIPDDD